MYKHLLISSLLIALSSQLPLTSENKFLKDIGKKEDGYYSQYGQDKYLDEVIFSKTYDGIFVDIGAHNGIALSNTKFFEEKGWKGICIEPIPSVFNELRKNRSALCIQGCISNKVGKAKFLKVEGYPEMLSGLLDKYESQHLARTIKESAIPANESNHELIEVDVFLLNDVLEKNNIFHVDYLSIDTEGGEFDILKSIDFDRFDIEVIDVENNYQDQALVNFILSKGYRHLIRIGCDDIFRKKNL